MSTHLLDYGKINVIFFCCRTTFIFPWLNSCYSCRLKEALFSNDVSSLNHVLPWIVAGLTVHRPGRGDRSPARGLWAPRTPCVRRLSPRPTTAFIVLLSVSRSVKCFPPKVASLLVQKARRRLSEPLDAFSVPVAQKARHRPSEQYCFYLLLLFICLLLFCSSSSSSLAFLYSSFACYLHFTYC